MRSSANPGNERFYERLTLNERIQHMVLMASFFLLVLTGLPLRFPEAPGSALIVELLGGFTIRGALHRLGAVMLIGLTIYHFLYVALSRRGRSELWQLAPRPKDLFDAIQDVMFYIGLEDRKPRFDRYSYIEKFEYLAVVWGSLVMIATGFLLWFEDQALELIPKWVLDVASIIHSWEAILAFLAIIIWHFYHVHLNPEVFPMSRVWLTGQVSEHDLKANHPMEYERLMGQAATGGEAPQNQRQDQRKERKRPATAERSRSK